MPLIVHGRILWMPGAQAVDPEQFGRFPLIGKVLYEHLLVAPAASLGASATCPMIDAARWQFTSDATAGSA